MYTQVLQDSKKSLLEMRVVSLRLRRHILRSHYVLRDITRGEYHTLSYELETEWYYVVRQLGKIKEAGK